VLKKHFIKEKEKLNKIELEDMKNGWNII